MSENKNVYAAVFTSQDRQFDEFGHGYLPLFHTVFGIYEDMGDAFAEVYKFLYSEKRGFEVLEDMPYIDEYGCITGHSFTFRYEDKDTGALGLYEIEITEESITSIIAGKGNRMSELEQMPRFGMTPIEAEPKTYNLECTLDDIPCDVPVEGYTMKVDYTR